MKVDWVGLYPEDLAGAVDTVHPLHDLFDLDLGVLLRKTEGREASREARGRARAALWASHCNGDMLAVCAHVLCLL